MAFTANEGVSLEGKQYDREVLVKDAKNKHYRETKLGNFIYSFNNLETGSIELNRFGKICIFSIYSVFKSIGIADSDLIGRRFA